MNLNNRDNQKLHAAMHAGYLVSVQWVHFDLTLVWAHSEGAVRLHF